MYQHKDWMCDIPGYINTYWGNDGEHQEKAKMLQSMVPFMGESANPYIEVFRHASNFYYDRYNNGHCNPSRTAEAAPVRAFMKKHKAPAHLKFKVKILDSELESAMDWLVNICYELYLKDKGAQK